MIRTIRAVLASLALVVLVPIAAFAEPVTYVLQTPGVV